MMWMPLRSVKMKGRMRGSQRRVWCPKWTPASSKSFIETTLAMACLAPQRFVLRHRQPGVHSPRRARHARSGGVWILVPSCEYSPWGGGGPCANLSPMTFAERLSALCRQRCSHVCVGLDPIVDRLPAAVRAAEDPVFAFNRALVDATIDLVPVYKPNLAFYEALGLSGWTSLKRTVEYIKGRAIVLGDAKRGDIDSTARAYASALFEAFGFDACTINVYLGHDAAAPFLSYRDRGVFVLCRTSNRSAADLQDGLVDGRPIYEHVARRAVEWNQAGNCGLVVGATYPAELSAVRAIAPGLPILIPGVGAQGGDAGAAAGAAAGGPFVISSSRAIIFASSGDDFAAAARRSAAALREQIAAAFAPA